LYQRLDLATADAGAGIAEVVVTANPRTYREQLTPDNKRRRPTQVVEAQFSIPFLVAAALLRGRVGISEVAGVSDPQVLALAARIRGVMREDAPAGWARLEVRRADGRTASLETTGPSGSPEKPLSDAQLQDKFRDCAAHAVRPIPPEKVEQAVRLIDHLDDSPDATALVRLFS
jgi:2-methylcitrate dehydratase PrpD